MDQRPSILVVDDVPANVLALEALLEPMQARIVACGSGDEALRVALREDFCLALLDVRMPDMDGYELARLLRGRRRTKSMPIVFVTANHMETEHALRGYEVGAVDYILKPVDPGILRCKVETFIRLERRSRDVHALADRLRDQVERRRLVEAELRQREGALTRANAELDAFALHAAHDLRAPLRTIGMFAEMVQEDLAEGAIEQARDGIERVLRGADRLERLVEGVLELARVGSDIVLAPLDLADVVDAVREDLAHPLHTRDAELRIGALPRVRGDRAQLHRLLLNLVGNALKFVPETRTPRVTIEARPLDGWHEIRVCDNGVGVPKDAVERIFAPLCRLQTDVEGAGLGLAVCRRIVEAHGGRIRVESAEPEGAVLAFRLEAA